MEINSKKHVISVQRWDMIDVLIDRLGFLTTISEICLGSIIFLCFYSRHKQQKCRRDQCIHAYLHVLFYIKASDYVIITLTCSCHARKPASQYFSIILNCNPQFLKVANCHGSSNFTINNFYSNIRDVQQDFIGKSAIKVRIGFLIFVASNIISLKICF